jgi:hypothetical protein
MKAFWKSAAGTGLALSALFAFRSGFADSTIAAPESSLGVWQKHEYRFAYMGFTSTYSCDGLADKIKVLLIAAGARRDAKSQAGACASFGQPDKFANATLTFYTLAPVASDTPADAQPVNAVWRRVSLSALPPRQLSKGDCELVEQFGHSVLPMFTTRNIESHVTCVPHQLSGSNIDLRFEALAPPQPPAPQPAQSGGT